MGKKASNLNLNKKQAKASHLASLLPNAEADGDLPLLRAVLRLELQGS